MRVVLTVLRDWKGWGHHQSGGQALGQLVWQPLTQFSDLTGKNGDLTRHHSAAYHIHCGERAQEFLKRVSDVSSDVRNLLNKARAHMQEENRAKLHSTVSTVLFCTRQNLAFRGHRDSGRLTLEEPENNDGNFRALLRFRIAAGDKVLENHCLNASGNAQYTSPQVQNELLDTALELQR